MRHEIPYFQAFYSWTGILLSVILIFMMVPLVEAQEEISVEAIEEGSFKEKPAFWVLVYGIFIYYPWEVLFFLFIILMILLIGRKKKKKKK